MAAETLSDADLRRQLKSFGVDVGPITASTRTVYVRKLDSLLSNDKHQASTRVKPAAKRESTVTRRPSRAGSKSLNSFSSDESDSDREINRNNGSSHENFSSPSLLESWQSSRIHSSSTNDCSPRQSFDTSDYVRPAIRQHLNGPDGTCSEARLSKPIMPSSRAKLSVSENARTSSTDEKPSFRWRKLVEFGQTWQLISGILVFMVFFFVVAVVVGYFYVSNKSDRLDADFLLCIKDSQHNCTQKMDLPLLQKVLIKLLHELSMQAGNYDCGYVTESRNMSYAHVKSLVHSVAHSNSMDLDDVEHIMNRVYCVMSANSYTWKVLMYNQSNAIVHSCENKIEFLESTVGQKSIFCRMAQSVRFVFSAVAVCVGLLFLGGALVAFIRYRQKCAEAERQEVFDLVEKIIDMLKQNADAANASKHETNRSVQPYLAIPHVRDALIPIHQRQKKQAVWDQAVNFLSANESRVRVENQKIAGEDFVVWRWIQPTVEDGPKVWQGQAFGKNSMGGVRSRHNASVPVAALTTCLKIRNMFDISIESGTAWQKPIEDAVLDKCSDAAIVHIAVDTNSTDGCVYARCKDLESAGIAFKALHGWWFDGRLVTVKYLREQRYEERYPLSQDATAPLQPSSPGRLSLSRPFHTSAIENS